jgi:hypothetical protein
MQGCQSETQNNRVLQQQSSIWLTEQHKTRQTKGK